MAWLGEIGASKNVGKACINHGLHAGAHLSFAGMKGEHAAAPKIAASKQNGGKVKPARARWPSGIRRIEQHAEEVKPRPTSRRNAVAAGLVGICHHRNFAGATAADRRAIFYRICRAAAKALARRPVSSMLSADSILAASAETDKRRGEIVKCREKRRRPR